MNYFNKSVIPYYNYFGESFAKQTYLSKYKIPAHLKHKSNQGSHSSPSVGEHKRSPLERRF